MYQTSKKIYQVLLAFVFVLASGWVELSVSAIGVSAQSAVVIEAESGRVLYGKNENAKRSMASTTKIMTGLLALEYGSPDTVIVATDEMVRVEGTSLGLHAGDSISMRDLTAGLMLESGNDCANAIALTLSPTFSDFAVLMNRRAKELGLSDTNFVTPSGLDDKNHYTTAYDLARLGAAALKNEAFAQIVSSKKITVSFGNPPIKQTIYNHNRMLTKYPGATGIKTGFTKKSGRCLVSSAQKDGVTLVAVTLHAPDDWDDHTVMLDYGFSQVSSVFMQKPVEDFYVPVVGGKQSEVKLVVPDQIKAPVLNREQESITYRVDIPKFIYAPVDRGETVGSIHYYIGDKRIASAGLTTQDFVERAVKQSLYDRIEEFFYKLFGGTSS